MERMKKDMSKVSLSAINGGPQQNIESRHLNDEEAVEWTELSLDFAPIVLSSRDNSLRWLPNADPSPQNPYCLIWEKKTTILDPLLAHKIWKEKYPKKMNFFSSGSTESYQYQRTPSEKNALFGFDPKLCPMC